MFIKNSMIITAFEELIAIAPHNEGKVARERLSGLKYFLATAELLIDSGMDKIRIAPDQKENRLKFITAVGRVIKLDEDGGYTNNFRDEFDRQSDYKVGNNFLTASLKKDGPYPGRPAPLIDREDESVSLLSGYETNFDRYGDLNQYRIPLALWLLRFDDFGENKNISSEALASKGNEILENRYGEAIKVFLKSSNDLKSYIDQFNQPFLCEDKADYYLLLMQKYEAPMSTEAVVGKNIMLYGAPGTGKSYRLKKFFPCIRTVFHGDYQNSDFVGTYRPFVDKGEVTYKYVPGPFIESFVRALKNPHQQQYLIIDEINRANAGSVFGEVFQLLDRDKYGKSEYLVDPDIATKAYLDSELEGIAECPDGHFKIPHLWPGQNPPATELKI